MSSLKILLDEIRACRECHAHLPLGPKPIVAAGGRASILIVGQAPGIRVHQSGVPWADPSGERLREWMAITSTDFYNENKVALVPMGFCYPGTGNSGDLPPRPECARLWHDRLLSQLVNVRLTLVIGRYAQNYLLSSDKSLTKTVASWKQYRPKYLPMPHPSPRNNRWLKTNPWFVNEVVPYLRGRVKKLLS